MRLILNLEYVNANETLPLIFFLQTGSFLLEKKCPSFDLTNDCTI